MDEMVGRADMLRVDESALHTKTATLDLGPILTSAASLAPGEPRTPTTPCHSHLTLTTPGLNHT